MSISQTEIQTLATLARLQTNADQEASLRKDLDRILAFVDQMNSLNTAAITPLANPLEMTQRLREDRVSEEDRREVLQEIAPAVEKGLYLVPRVIDTV